MFLYIRLLVFIYRMHSIFNILEIRIFFYLFVFSQDYRKIKVKNMHEKNKYQYDFFARIIFLARKIQEIEILQFWSRRAIKIKKKKREASLNVALVLKESFLVVFLDVTLLYIHNQMTFVQKTLLCTCVS